jgi:hypothetical protein
MEKIMQFFNLDLPCPDEIPDCQHLRNKYVEELGRVKARGGCGSCMERKLKNDFILRLQEILIKR